MPLVQGSSDAAIQENIRRLIKEGKSPEQAAAIAYSIAREVRKKRKKRQR
jgi:threonine synthase